MNLMKELITKTVTEDAEDGIENLSSNEIARFKRIWDLIERDLEHLDAVLKDGSGFGQLVVKGGGDGKLLESVRADFKKFYDDMHDLHMSLGVAQGDNWD